MKWNSQEVKQIISAYQNDKSKLHTYTGALLALGFTKPILDELRIDALDEVEGACEVVDALEKYKMWLEMHMEEILLYQKQQGMDYKSIQFMLLDSKRCGVFRDNMAVGIMGTRTKAEPIKLPKNESEVKLLN